MTQAKPAAKPAAAAAPAAAPKPAPEATPAPAPEATPVATAPVTEKSPPPPEDTPEEIEKVQMSWEKIKVKNIGKRCLNLANGPIEKDKTGTATVAEFSCLAQYMEKV